MSKEAAKYVDEKLEEVEDILLGLKDIMNYTEPNFVEFKDGEPKLYLVRCYQCPDVGSYGRENYIPNVSLGGCTWCGWRSDPKVVEEIMKNKMITSGLPVKEGITLDEIKERYPEAYQAAVEGKAYTPDNQEDDGEID